MRTHYSFTQLHIAGCLPVTRVWGYSSVFSAWSVIGQVASQATLHEYPVTRTAVSTVQHFERFVNIGQSGISEWRWWLCIGQCSSLWGWLTLQVLGLLGKFMNTFYVIPEDCHLPLYGLIVVL